MTLLPISHEHMSCSDIGRVLEHNDPRAWQPVQAVPGDVPVLPGGHGAPGAFPPGEGRVWHILLATTHDDMYVKKRES